MGKRLRLYRTALDLTQESIAQSANVSVKSVSAIENGHVSPSIDALWRIVEIGLGMPLATFFTEDDTRDDLAPFRPLLARITPAMRRRALRVLRALFDE